MFTSPTGVDVFLEELKECRKDVRNLGTVKLAAIGEERRRSFRREAFCGSDAEGIRRRFLGEALAEVVQPESGS